MNSTFNSSDAPAEDGTEGFNRGLSVGVLLTIVVVLYVAYIFIRLRFFPNRITPRFLIHTTTHAADRPPVAIQQALDKATFLTYPKLLYSQAKLHRDRGGSAASGCSICLADYKATDMLRLLPDCGHLFHLKCIDPWLSLHPTCPICRTSPIPTPLAEVVPPPATQN